MISRVLVTGGAGFVGANLCRRLLSDGHAVVVLDNFATSARQNIVDLLENPNFSLVTHDVVEPYDLDVDAIYNLACPASPVHYAASPVDTTRTCVLGAINALESARKLRVPVFQASTSEVYGDPEIHPQTEEYWGRVNPIGPRACYDEGKRCAETLFFDYRRMYDVRIKVMRIFNTYGPLMHPNDGRVVSNIVLQALRGEDITIYGDGSQTRSFCYVDDLVEAMVLMMATADPVTGPLNIGNPHEVTVEELARRVLDLTGSRSRLVFRPLPIDDPRRRQPDISAARATLRWEPLVSLDEGLNRTIKYFAALLTGAKTPVLAIR